MIDISLVKESTLVVEGINHRDAPDYCDAYFSYGEYHDGTILTDEQLDKLAKVCPDMLYDALLNTIY